MQTVLYYGMNNKPIEVFKQQHINNRYQTVTEYYTLDGKKVMFQAINNAIAYNLPYNYKQYPNHSIPIIHAGSIVSPDIINKGYSSHNFDIVLI
jgi:hypothetical protein